MRYLEDGLGRSHRAEDAIANRRMPKTMAARELGISPKAFELGCVAVGYFPTEWHHTGKYGDRTTFYDLQAVEFEQGFWGGAVAAYRSAKKRAEILGHIDAYHGHLADEMQMRQDYRELTN